MNVLEIERHDKKGMSIYDSLADYEGSALPAAPGGSRVRLSNRAVKDLREWVKVVDGGRIFVKENLAWALHTDAAELGWGGTLGPGEGPGVAGLEKDAEDWTAEERKESMTFRELKAVHLVLGLGLGLTRNWARHDVKRVKLYIDNMGSKFIISRRTSKSRGTMREVSVLQRLLMRLGMSIDPS